MCLCIAYVDRPLATYMHRTVYATPLFVWAMRIFPVLLAIGGALIVLLLGVGVAALAGQSVRPWMSVVQAVGGAGLAGFLVAELLKFIVGRSQVHPTYLMDGIYGVSPFHAGRGYGAFPSATETVSSAVLVVLWFWWPRARPAFGIVLLIVSAALIVTNSHWVSDLLGGVLLGGSAGCALLRRLPLRHSPGMELTGPR